MENKFSMRIATDDSKEDKFVEVFYNGDQWAEISQEKKDPVVTFLSPTSKEYWEFDYHEAIKALETAKKHLFDED